MPALRPMIGNARLRSSILVTLSGRVHPDSDRKSQKRRDGCDSRSPDHELTPQRLVLPQRREIQPMRNGSEIGPESRSTGSVLDYFSVYARNIYLLTVGPRVLP